MAGNVSIPSLSEDVRSVIWRIFGAGTSPLTGRSTRELIESVIRKRVSHTEQDRAIAEIYSWFEVIGDEWRLRPDMADPVGVMIIDGVGSDRSEIAVFAVGSIDGELAASTIGSKWPAKEIDSFVEATLNALEHVCNMDQVLDATRVPDLASFDADNAKIPKESLRRRGRLEAFRNLAVYGHGRVYRGLYPAVENLIRIVADLRRESLRSLIKRVDHPVIQARVAEYMVRASNPSDHRDPLRWITEDSCDAEVALAILHILNAVESPDPGDSDERDDDLLTALVNSLAGLRPLACAGWMGELLANAPYVLRQVSEYEIPVRLKQLEEACTEVIARLVRLSWSEDLFSRLRAGLCLTPRTTWPRHLANVAWALRDVAPARAVEIAHATLDEDQRYVAHELELNHLFLHWADWHTREWMSGLGDALALSVERLDLPAWVSTQCRALPLSVWDAEEDSLAFNTADRAVQHWFLVAFHAVESMIALGRTVDPGAVRSLAEALWAHCHFAEQNGVNDVEAPIASEYAARACVEYGDPNGEWLLGQVRNPGVGPRALWALVDQRMQKTARGARLDTGHDEMINSGILRYASERFGDGTQFGLEALQFWGRLWLLLDAADRAEQTATVMLTFTRRRRERGSNILVLKLLALAASKRKLALAMESQVVSTYHHLWSSYTPSEERDDRRRIDEQLERSGIRT